MPDVNFTNQMLQTLAGYQRTAPGYYDLYSRYAGPYTDLNNATTQRGLFGSENQPGALAINRGATAYNRAGDIADVSALGRSGYDALLQSNPGLAAALGQANATGAASNAPGSLLSILQNHALDDSTSPVLSALNKQANDALASGGALSPQEERDNLERTRSGFSDRGMVLGNPALGAELLNRDALRRQRLQAAQTLAGNVENLNQASLGGRRQFALGVQGAVGQNQSQLGSLASLNAGIYDPYQTTIGRGSSGLAGLGSGGSNTSATGSGFNLQSLFNPAAGSDAYGFQANANAAQNIANQNRNTAIYTGLINAGGSVLGGLISDERLKENITTIGEAPLGNDESKRTRVIEWNYRTDPNKVRYRGRSAQDMEKIAPHAVITDPITGLKAVNYGAIGERMTVAGCN